jgi:hypothetical protein
MNSQTGDKTECNNYCGALLLSNFIYIYIYEITRDLQCWFRYNQSTTDQNFCIHQILEEKMGVK